jgi:signal transduction histidine kinase
MTENTIQSFDDPQPLAAGPGSAPYVECMNDFFKRMRLLNAVGHSGSSLVVFAFTSSYVETSVGVTYLVIHQLLMCLVVFTFYSEWTNARLDKYGLPKYVLYSNLLAKSFMPCILWMNLGEEFSYSFCLSVLTVVLACAAGTMVTLGPLRRLARQDLICMVLPVTVACFYFGHPAIALSTIFFLLVVAFAGLDEMHKTYSELVFLRVNSLRDTQVLNQSNRQLKTAILSLQEEAQYCLEMEKEQKKLQENLIAASREAGKAEIATGVLHNVGNVMNSVNVSSSVMQNNLQNGLQGQLASAIKLLEEHSDNLGGFFENDNRGLHFIPFMKDLNRQAISILDEIQELRNNIDHVNGVVAAQQSYATSGGLISTVDLVDVMNASLQIVREEYRQNRIHVVKKLPDQCEVTTDQQKLIQILVNLFNNAKNAINDQSPDKRTVEVRIQVEPNDMVLILVSDTGAGITSKNLSKIFQHGFSTRKGRGGHGFGLHHSYLSLKEMGGNLSARSEGPGLGATFSIQIPVNKRNLSKSNQATVLL